MSEKKMISPLIKDKYQMKAGFEPGSYIFKMQTIDTSICDLATAEAMVAIGFKELELVVVKSEKPVVK